jgi:hypothetical protein
MRIKPGLARGGNEEALWCDTWHRLVKTYFFVIVAQHCRVGPRQFKEIDLCYVTISGRSLSAA